MNHIDPDELPRVVVYAVLVTLHVSQFLLTNRGILIPGITKSANCHKVMIHIPVL